MVLELYSEARGRRGTVPGSGDADATDLSFRQGHTAPAGQQQGASSPRYH